MTTSDFTTEPRELDFRSADGLDVRLFWHETSNAISVSVFDSTREQAFDVTVDAADALDAFHHPFAYAASRGVPFQTPLRAQDEEPLTV